MQVSIEMIKKIGILMSLSVNEGQPIIEIKLNINVNELNVNVNYMDMQCLSDSFANQQGFEE